MTDTKAPIPNFEPISEELVQRVSGGSCTVQDVADLLDQLKENYDSLVDFTSYVIERVVTSTTN